MALTAGARLGAYEILSLLGSGGMGEVYRARDTKLNRDVAIKVLPESLASDSERLARFEREARVLASLNHPNIAHIHGFEDSTGVPALVMELVEGPTLADRIAKGPLPIDEALPIARQIAEALQAAHDRGIIHRDLKPANIAFTKDGTMKVLDFGLAKPTEAADATSIDVTNSPTQASPALMTGTGTILGTAAYLSPEQARGKPADKRSDLWAFGCVFYEMLVSRRPFDGKDATDVIAAILRAEPDWAALPTDTPPSIRRLLRRCLEKDRQRRLADASDACLDIDDALGAPSTERSGPPRSRVVPIALAAVGGAMSAALVTWAVTRPAPHASPSPVRFAIVPPPTQPMGLPRVQRDLALSPDGRHIVYRSSLGTGGGQLAVRDLDQIDGRLIEGIANAREPFFSADSRWIGFFDGDELKKVAVAGGPAITICQVRGSAGGASWGDDNTIIFATTDPATGLFHVSAAGDDRPTVLTTPAVAQHEGDHLYPSILPGGRGVLFTVTSGRADTASVSVLDLHSGQRKTLIPGGSAAQYVDSGTASAGQGEAGPRGYLLYASGGTLRAVGFDLARLAVVGESTALVDDLLVNGPGAAEYAVSRSGALVYVPGSSEPQRRPRSLVWVDRSGHEEAIKAPLRGYGGPRLSPDGTRIVVDIKDRQNDVWVWNLDRETLTRLTSDGASFPVWSPDGRRVVFSSWRLGDAQNLFVRLADGVGPIDALTTSSYYQVASSITPDGTHIIGYGGSEKTQRDITLVAMASSATRPVISAGAGTATQVEALVQTPFNELNGEISPDGRYLAYQSDESGQYEVYVSPFPQVIAGRWQISIGGGTQPAWARSSQELFYLDSEDRLTAVSVRTSGATFSATKPGRVLDAKYGSPEVRRTYDVSADSRRFLMVKESGDPNASQMGITVVLNWQEELKQRVPAR